MSRLEPGIPYVFKPIGDEGRHQLVSEVVRVDGEYEADGIGLTKAIQECS
jgi:hypothetical protein